LPFSEWAPEGARARIINSSGGYYDDVYVKTPQGWRIKARKYFPPVKACRSLTSPRGPLPK